jgi:hypothetical protein
MFNELRIGYNRRANSTPPRATPPSGDTNWSAALGIPGVSAPGLPYFNIGYGIGAMNTSREVGEDHILQDNVTRLEGKHSLKMGYQMMQTWYDLKNASLPQGQYNFGGTEAFTPKHRTDLRLFPAGVGDQRDVLPAVSEISAAPVDA